jgi:predicted site-specific integrase-resolvase
MERGEVMNAKQFAEAMQVEYTTVIRWLKLGLVPGAQLREIAPGMKWWAIPYEALTMERLPAGRRKKKSRGGKSSKKGKS